MRGHEHAEDEEEHRETDPHEWIPPPRPPPTLLLLFFRRFSDIARALDEEHREDCEGQHHDDDEGEGAHGSRLARISPFGEGDRMRLRTTGRRTMEPWSVEFAGRI